MKYRAVAAYDEESQQVPRDGGFICPWATKADAVVGCLLSLAVIGTVALMVVRDFAPPEDCGDILKVPKHNHCVPHALQKARSFSEVLEAQGTKREHSSVVARERERKATAAARNASIHRRPAPNGDEDTWLDPRVFSHDPGER